MMIGTQHRYIISIVIQRTDEEIDMMCLSY